MINVKMVKQILKLVLVLTILQLATAALRKETKFEVYKVNE